MSLAPTITMPKDEAIRAYREFRQACHGNPTNEDQAILMGLNALRKGHAIIDLHQAMSTAGADAQGCPRLAIARCSWEWCHMYLVGPRQGLRFQERRGWIDRRNVIGKRLIEIPASLLPGITYQVVDRVRAAVPYLPPSVRPGNLQAYCILWEAEWRPIPPRDPMLLQHLRGSLFAVLAVWDLTELERAVMGSRFQEQR